MIGINKMKTDVTERKIMSVGNGRSKFIAYTD